MPVIAAHKDPEDLALRVVAEFAAPVERVWQVWADPRLLERWWGPPTWPATFERHEVRVGGRSHYYLTGPEGQRNYAWWATTLVDEPHRYGFDGGLADAEYRPLPGMPAMHGTVDFEPLPDGGTRMTATTRFDSLDDLEKMVAMGQLEGTQQAMGQIDALL